MARIRVVLAEDGDLLRAGVMALLDGYDDIDVVGTATNLPELLAATRLHRRGHPGSSRPSRRWTPQVNDR